MSLLTATIIYTEKNGTDRTTQLLIRGIMSVVSDTTPMTTWRAVIEIILQAQPSRCTHRKNVGINNTLRHLCLREGVVRIGPYDYFFNMTELFQKNEV